MTLSKYRIIQFTIAVLALIVTIFLFMRFLPDKEQQAAPGAAGSGPASHSEGFTFFTLSAQSVFNDDLRETLSERLGADAYETRTTIDLEMHDRGFIGKYFPDLAALNRRLNHLYGERVEHDTIQLTYRYARKKNTPFDYVRLLFSGDTRTPLVFMIRSKVEGGEFLDAIREKYGHPTTLKWDEGNGQSHYWEKNGDMLVISETQTRIGTPQYLFGFYFMDNIKALLEKEEAERARRREAREKTGRKAF